MNIHNALSALILCLIMLPVTVKAGELIRLACVQTNDPDGQLNVRSAGNLSAPVVSRIRNGQCGVTVVGYCGPQEKAGYWCTIQFGQIRFGVVNARYLRLADRK